MTTSLRVLARRLCAAPRFAAGADEVAGERIVEFRKVAPNDAHVERAQDQFLWLAIEEKAHHGLDAARRLAPSLAQRSALIRLDRDPMPAFAGGHAIAQNEPTSSGGAARRGRSSLGSLADAIVQTAATSENGIRAEGCCSVQICRRSDRPPVSCRGLEDQRPSGALSTWPNLTAIRGDLHRLTGNQLDRRVLGSVTGTSWGKRGGGRAATP